MKRKVNNYCFPSTTEDWLKELIREWSDTVIRLTLYFERDGMPINHRSNKRRQEEVPLCSSDVGKP